MSHLRSSLINLAVSLDQMTTTLLLEGYNGTLNFVDHFSYQKEKVLPKAMLIFLHNVLLVLMPNRQPHNLCDHSMPDLQYYRHSHKPRNL
jgi:hypothetical protein